jgi:hypothetical protein
LSRQVAAWAAAEEEQGHEISKTDLMDYFQHCLSMDVIRLEEKQADAGLTGEEQAQLESHRKKQTTFKDDRLKLAAHRRFLAARCDLTERAKQRTTPLSQQEEVQRMAGWQGWDRLLYLVAAGSEDDLADWVAQPAKFIDDRRDTVITMSDQVPVWLKPDSGKRLRPRAAIAAASKSRAERKRRQEALHDRTQDEAAAQQPRTTIIAAGNPANSRSRYTLCARQLIAHYFDERRQPEGRIDTSIIIAPGRHARLENISPDGFWLTDESFTVNGKLTVRKKGDSAGKVMAGWRALRSEQPELFQNILVWQSPTAFCDSVIWSWQQDEEAARFRNSLRLVDALATHWTLPAQERNWLQQSLQGCIPPGCTPLCQVTDTGLAQPAKAAAKEEHDRLRSLMRQKARMSQTGCPYKVGNREILQTVQAMHERMVELNRQSATVLAEARAGGWLHWRPRGGRLELADAEDWAQPLTEGSSRMGPNFRLRRDSFVLNGQPLAWTPDSTQQDKIFAADCEPQEKQTDYFDDDALELAGCTETRFEEALSREMSLAAMLHPALRSAHEQRLAELLLMTDQGAKIPRCQKTTKLSRQEKAATWRSQFTSEMTVLKRLGQLTSVMGKQPAKKASSKKPVKIWKGAKTGAARKSVKKAAAKAAEAASAEPVGGAEKAAAAAAATDLHTSLVGCQGRCIAATANQFWQNSDVRIQQVSKDGKRLKVALTSTGTEAWHNISDIVITEKTVKTVLKSSLDLRKLPADSKRAGYAACAVLTQAALEEPCTDDQIQAGWLQLKFRAEQTHPESGIDLCRFFSPAAVKLAVSTFRNKDSTWQHESAELCEALKSLSGADTGGLLFLPVRSEKAGHWTLLTVCKTAGQRMSMQYFDSLKKPSQACREEAAALNSLMQTLTSQDLWDSTVLPQASVPAVQTDNWSCGWHCLSRAEEKVRQFRGEGITRCYRTAKQWVEDTNKVLSQLSKQKETDKKKADKQAAEEEARDKALAAAAEETPAPTPASALAAKASASACAEAAAQAFAAKMKADAEAKSKTGTEAAERAAAFGRSRQQCLSMLREGKPAPVLAPAPQRALAAGPSWGCSKCRYSDAGCKACNPEKQSAWLARQSEKKKEDK